MPPPLGQPRPSVAKYKPGNFGLLSVGALCVVLFIMGDWNTIVLSIKSEKLIERTERTVEAAAPKTRAKHIRGHSEIATNSLRNTQNINALGTEGDYEGFCEEASTLAWPPSVRNLCSLFKADVKPDLAKFFGSKTPLITASSADLNSGKNDGGVNGTMGTVCGRRYREWRYNFMKGDKRAKLHAPQPSFKPIEMHHNAYSSKFMAEVILPYIPDRTQYRADSVESADIVFVSLCVGAMGRQGATLADLPRLIENKVAGQGVLQIFKTRPWDIVATVSNDHGPCPNFREALGGSDAENHNIIWHGEDALKEITMLTNEGSLRHECYTPPLHMTVPTTTAIGSSPLACTKSSLEERSNFMFVAGESSSRIRYKVFTKFASDPEVFTPPQKRMPYEEYMCTMADSIFCLVLRGAAAWSPRLDESVLTECIPVLVVDSYEPPFSRLLDYRTFAVMIEEESVQDNVHLIKDKLLEISVAERNRLFKNLRKIKPLFRYPDIEEKAEYAGNSMFDITIFQLWRERKARENYVRSMRGAQLNT